METAFTIGIKPSELWEMELWELNHCICAYNSKLEEERRDRTITVWRIAAFSGAAFAGKLKPLEHYLKDAGRGTRAPRVSKEEFAARLSKAKRKSCEL